MATVRELIAKFGFDIDTKPLEQFNEEFGKTKKAIKTFAIGALLKGFSDIGKEFDVLRRNIGLFGDEAQALDIAQGLDRSVSSVVDATRAIRNSLEDLSDIDFTKKIIQDAEDFAAITGESLDDIMKMIAEAAKGGDLQPLQRLGLTNQQEVESLQRMNIEMRTATLKTIVLNRLEATRADRQKKLAKATKDLDVQQRRSGKIIEDYGLVIADFINPILSAMLEIFNDIAEFFLTSSIGKFIGKVLALAGGLKVLWTVGRLLLPVFKFVGSVVSGLASTFGAAAAAIGFLVVWIHDLWAALSDPKSAWFFTEGGNNYFKTWVEDIQELKETFDFLTESMGKAWDMVKNFVGEQVDVAGEKISAGFDTAYDFINKLELNPTKWGGNGEQKTETSVKIDINANSPEAAKAGAQEAVSQIKKTIGPSDIETSYNTMRARQAIVPGGR